MTLSSLEELEKLMRSSWRMVREPRMKLVLRIQEGACRAIREYLSSQGFTEALPPIIGPVTDPGIRGAKQATIDYYGMEYKVMSSAILYKQLLASSLGRVFFFSPNIRLEPIETATTGRHLVEFFQVDIEAAEEDYMGAMRIAEGLLSHVVGYIRDEYAGELEELGRELRHCAPPFKKYAYSDALKLLESHGRRVVYGAEIPWSEEAFLSSLHDEPFFIYDYPRGSRGFYDREDPERPGILRDFDMLYPEGFGEAVSGAEREHTYEKVIERMRETGEDPRKYGWYLEMLREGIPLTAGFGIGVERLTRYLCGLSAVWEARPYPKLAGIYSP